MVRPARPARAQGRDTVQKLIAAVALLAACASPGFPPGGPELTTPPELVAVTPDSGALRTAPRAVVFRFDRVLSERPHGVTDLTGVVLISPTDGLPRVSWQRQAISVRPRRDWRPNTVYTVTLLPGLSDLRGNAVAERITTVFATGTEIPDTRVDGILFDWVAGRPAPRSSIEALRLSDSTLFVARADSTGRFEMRHLTPGSYRVRGYIDLNNNRTLDEREPWDTTMVVLQDSASVELLTFVHDTVPPAVQQITATDSVTLQVTFSLPINPRQQLSVNMFELIGPDSVPVPADTVLRQAEWTAALRAAGDTLPPEPPAAPEPARPGAIPTPVRRPAPVPSAPLEEPSRPPPATILVLTLRRPLEGGTPYRLRVSGVEGILGATAPSERSFTPPRAQETPATPAEEPPGPPPPPPQ